MIAARLTAALSALCPLDGVSVGTPGDLASVTLQFAPEATAEQRAAAEAALPAAWLAAHKAARCEQINARTAALIGQGFTFDGVRFSLSPNAQINASALNQVRADLSYPQAVSTAAGGEYGLTDADHCRAFALAMLGAVKARLDSGRALRLQVLACSTVEQVQAVVDDRT